MTKQVSLADSVYEQLSALKTDEYETFNGVVQRLLDSYKKKRIER